MDININALALKCKMYSTLRSSTTNLLFTDFFSACPVALGGLRQAEGLYPVVVLGRVVPIPIADYSEPVIMIALVIICMLS